MYSEHFAKGTEIDVSEQGPERSQAALDRIDRLAGEDLRVVVPSSHFFRGAVASWKDIWDHRELWWLLVKRELKARYKDSTLGFLWTLIRPLVQLLIYYFAIGQILGASRAIENFGVYVFAGLTAWGLFNEIIASSTGSIVGNSGIIKKVYLPREIFPLAAAGAAFINFCAQMVVLLAGAIIISGIHIPSLLTYVPLSIIVILVWGIAAGLFLSAINVYLRDVQYLVEVSLLIGMWLCPIVYSYSMVVDAAPAWLAELYLMNPMANAVLGFQAGVWAPSTSSAAPLPDNLLTSMLIFIAIGLVLIVLSQRYFAKSQRNFAQEL